MRIIMISTSTNEGLVTVHVDLIKPLQIKPMWLTGPYKISRATVLNGYAHTEQRIALIDAKIDATDKEPQRFVLKHMDVTLSGSAMHTLSAITFFESCFKLDMANIILMDEDASLAKLIPGLLAAESSLYSKEAAITCELPFTINEFIQHKKQTKPQHFYQDLVSYIVNNPKNKNYKFLSAFYLLDPEHKGHANILQNLFSFFRNVADGRIRKEFMTLLNDHAIDSFIKPCIGKIAEDGGPYNKRYTELEAFRESEFTLIEDNCVKINPLHNNSYKAWYPEGKRNFGKLKDEWIYLGKILGIEFDKKSIWDNHIILTKESSSFLIRNGLLYNEKFMEEMPKKLEKIMLFRNGFFYDNQSTNRQMHKDLIDTITADYIQLL